MSTNNSLNSYRTHSYHHALVCCDTTDTAEELAGNNDIKAYEYTTTSKYKTAKSGGTYTVLLNGSNSIERSITELKWILTLAPQTSNVLDSSLATEGHMTIEEPNGYTFLNDMTSMFKRMDTTPNGVCYLLKTFFVGHTHDGKVEYINNIRPLYILLTDLQASFNEGGSEYNIEFTGVSNGASKSKAAQTVARGLTVQIGHTADLDFGIANVVLALNQNYNKTIDRYNKQDDKSNTNTKKPIRYDIVLNGDIGNFTVSTNNNTNTNNTNNDMIIVNSTKNNIKDLIIQVLKSSKDFLSYLVNTKQKYIISDEMVIRKDVIVYKYTVSLYQLPYADKITQQILTTNNNSILNDKLEYDYIFTGKNIDILTYEMKLSMGLSFHELIMHTSTDNNARETISHSTEQVSSSTSSDNSFGNVGDRINSPNFTSRVDPSPEIANTKSPESVSAFRSSLNRFAALEQAYAEMTVRGDPNILDRSTVNTTINEASHITDYTPMYSGPLYVKVNVKTPFTNDYSNKHEDFWYTGWYYILSVQNNFVDGLFTQTLSMMSVTLDTNDNITGLGKQENNNIQNATVTNNGSVAVVTTPTSTVVQGRNSIHSRGQPTNITTPSSSNAEKTTIDTLQSRRKTSGTR